jgi:hypothetical protein
MDGDNSNGQSKIEGRDPETGRFLTGNSGNGGRKKGSRARLGEDFLADLHDAWSAHGEAALIKCATNEPTAFVKVVANVLPREVLLKALNVNATVDLSTMEETKGFLEAYRYARDRIGATPLDHIEEGAVVSEAWRVDNDE